MIEKGEREREKWITVHSLSSSNSFTNCPNKWFFAIFESDNPKMMIFSEWDTILYCLFSFLRQKEDIEVGICTRIASSGGRTLVSLCRSDGKSWWPSEREEVCAVPFSKVYGSRHNGDRKLSRTSNRRSTPCKIIWIPFGRGGGC